MNIKENKQCQWCGEFVENPVIISILLCDDCLVSGITPDMIDRRTNELRHHNYEAECDDELYFG
jgi:hypothetical protein